MVASACGLAQHFQDLGHSLLVYGPTLSRQITFIFFVTLSKHYFYSFTLTAHIRRVLQMQYTDVLKKNSFILILQ